MSPEDVVFQEIKIKVSPGPMDSPDAFCTIEESPVGAVSHTISINLSVDRKSLARIRACRTSSNELQQFGQRLLSSLFPAGSAALGNPRAIYESSALNCSDPNQGLRIRLILPLAGSIAELPWEYIYDPSSRAGPLGAFPLLTRGNSLLRSSIQVPPRPESVFYPVRILVVGASPNHPSYSPINLQNELEQINNAVPADLRSRFQIETLIPATRRALESRLNDPNPSTAPHWIHFVCHGDISPDGTKALVLEEAAPPGFHGGPDYLMATQLIPLLRQKSAIRAVVLNACSSALGTGVPPQGVPESVAESQIAAVAQALVSAGVPIVIAMQADLPDDVATDFTTRFYQHIFSYLSRPSTFRKGMFEKAVQAARHAIVAGRSIDHPAWGIPVIYCSGMPEEFLDFREPPKEEDRRRQIEDLKEFLQWLQTEDTKLLGRSTGWAIQERQKLQAKIASVRAEIDRLLEQQ